MREGKIETKRGGGLSEMVSDGECERLGLAKYEKNKERNECPTWLQHRLNKNEKNQSDYKHA